MIPEGTSVTLVEPKYPVNVGHVARLLKNFGMRDLYLVRPSVDISVAAMYASHATDVLEGAREVEFDEVRESHELLVATTAVRATRKANLARRMVAPGDLRQMLLSAKTSSLVFGRESTGLTNEEIGMCDATLTLDTDRRYRSLNIGHAVAIVLYLASRRGGSARRIQSRKAREVFARGLSDLGVAGRYPARKVEGLFTAGKRVAASSGLSDEELQMLTGVMRKAVVTIKELQDADSNT